MFKVCKILAFVYWIAKKLHCRCSTRSWIPIPLTLMMHQSPCSCAFIVGFQQILYIGFHAYLTYFRNQCFHCFKQNKRYLRMVSKIGKNRCMVSVWKFTKILWEQNFFLHLCWINLDGGSWNDLGEAIFVTTLSIFHSNRNSQHPIK